MDFIVAHLMLTILQVVESVAFTVVTVTTANILKRGLLLGIVVPRWLVQDDSGSKGSPYAVPEENA